MTFTLDTSGAVVGPSRDESGPEWVKLWPDLSPFAQGYIEAMPWEDLNDKEFEHRCNTVGQGAEYPELGFRDLASETLAAILRDCAAWLAKYPAGPEYANDAVNDGAYLWKDRQNGLYVEDAFPPLTLYLGDNGKVYLKETT